MTTVAAIADIHGNWPALQTVFSQPEVLEADKIVVAGDIIGILGFNDIVVEQIQEHGNDVVIGNHDVRVLPRSAYAPSFPAAQDEMSITTTQLDEQHIEYLQSLPDRISKPRLVMGHARPFFFRDPGFPTNGFAQGDMGMDAKEFTRIGPHLDGRTAVIGHTHDQHAVDCDKFEGQSGLVVNPGSVGVPWFEPADYAIIDLDTQEYELRSASYDTERVADRLRELGYPPGKYSSDRERRRL